MNKLIHLLKKPKVLLPCLMLVTSATPVHASPAALIPVAGVVYSSTEMLMFGVGLIFAGGTYVVYSRAHDPLKFSNTPYWDKQEDIREIYIANDAEQYNKYLTPFKYNDRAKKIYDDLADNDIDPDKKNSVYYPEPKQALTKIFTSAQTINQDEQTIGPNKNSKQSIEDYARLITASVATQYLNSKNNVEFTELTQKVSEKSKEVLEYILNIKMTFGLSSPGLLYGEYTNHYYNISYLQLIRSLTNCVDITTFSSTTHSCGYKLTPHGIYDTDNSNYDLPKYLSRLIDEIVRNYNFDQYLIGEASDTVSTGGSSGGDDPGENNIPTTIDTDQSSNCTKVRLMPKMFFLNGRLYIPTPDYIRNKEEVSRWANTNGVNILLPQGFDQDNPTTHPNNIEITGFVRGGGGFCCTTQDSSRGRPDEEPYNRVVSYTNGYTYDGEYANGNPNGHGIMTFPNGDRYDGQWRDGNRNGHGIMTYANGDRYTGRWFRGDLRRGQMRYANGDVYDGAWEDGQRNGSGVMVYGNGERYDGAWLNGQRNGNRGMDYVLPWADLFFQA